MIIIIIIIIIVAIATDAGFVFLSSGMVYNILFKRFLPGRNNFFFGLRSVHFLGASTN